MKSSWGLSAVLLCCLAVPGWSQSTTPLRGAEKSSWFLYFGDQPMTKHYGLHLEAQYRAQGVGQQPTQLLLRSGLIRYLPHNLKLSMLYAYARDYPFDGGPLADPRRTGMQPEHRLTQELRWTHPVAHYAGKTAILQHRFRLEQRWFGQSTEGQGVYDWHFGERARYRAYLQLPLPLDTRGARPDYVALYDEVLLRFGPHGGHSAIDQNRTYGALGWKLSPTINVEVGYLHQYFPRANGFIGEHNNAFQLTINSVAPIKQLLGR